MKIEIAFTESEARSILYYLRKRYASKAELKTLCKLAIRCEVAAQARMELKEAESELSKTENSNLT